MNSDARTPGAAPSPSNPSGPVRSRPRRPRKRPSSTLSQRQLVVLFSGLAGLGLVIGSGAGLVVNAREKPTVLVGALVEPAPAPTVSPTPSRTTESSPTPTPTSEGKDDPDDRDARDLEPTPTGTGSPDYRPISANPSSEPGLDFGLLTKVVHTDGTVTLQFDRASFYTGLEAAQYNQGKLPPKGYLIENTNSAIRSFVLDPKASIVAANRLLTVPGQVGQETLTGAQFVDNTSRALGSAPLPVWLRHTDGLLGPVTALAEQYVP